MKHLLLYISVLFYFCSTATPEQKTEKEINKIEKIVDSCDNKFLTNEIQIFKNQIDSIIKKIQPKHKNLMGYSTEGGEALFYIVNNDTLLVIASFYGEIGKAEERFYNKDNIPILYEKTMYIYETPINIDSMSEIDHIEKDVVIMQNFIIEKWCHSSKEFFDKEFEAMSNTIRDSYNFIRNEQEEW